MMEKPEGGTFFTYQSLEQSHDGDQNELGEVSERSCLRMWRGHVASLLLQK
jgi:hypothetical protein